MSFSLYELDQQEALLMDMLFDAGGEISPEMEEDFAELLQARGEKVAGYIRIIRSFEAQADAYSMEAKRLSTLASSASSSAKRLKDRLLVSMQQRGDTEYLTPLGKVKRQRSGSRSVVLLEGHEDPAALPERFRRVRIEADTRAISDALKTGEEEAAAVAYLAEPTEYVRIY